MATKEAMMKHGLFVLVLALWVGWSCQAQGVSCRTALPAAELEEIEGGDLYLAVNRDSQTMTVTRVTPGDYRSAESYSVGVTTSVVRKKDVTATNPKNAMENTEREVKVGQNTVRPKQFPTGTANLNAAIGTQAGVEGPVIRTNATQPVNVVSGPNAGQTVPDYGYNIHFADPAIGSNTLGCVGVTNLTNMNRVVGSMKADQTSGTSHGQTVTVSPYSNPTPTPTPAATPKSSSTPTTTPKSTPPSPPVTYTSQSPKTAAPRMTELSTDMY